MGLVTPAFDERVKEIASQFTDSAERRGFLLGVRIAFQRTEENVHRWPLFDIFKDVASYRAVVGVFELHGEMRQFIIFYEKLRTQGGEPEPRWIWADHYPLES